jgi:hypothetical protein
MIEAEIVFFAIQAALKLYAGVRKAYVDATFDRALILPLPRASTFGPPEALDWFQNDATGKRAAARDPLVQQIIGQGITPANQAELIYLFDAHFAEALPAASPGVSRDRQITADELSKLLTVRQWGKNEDPGHASPLQQVAGTLVEIAVDYFATMPGAVSRTSPQGKALFAFLTAINGVDFANSSVKTIAGNLMVGVLDAVGSTPSLLAGGEKEQLLVKNVTTELAAAAKRHLVEGTTELDRRNAGDWLQVVAAAMAKGAADTVLENPALFFGVKSGAQSNVLQAVVGAIADLAISPDSLSLRPLLSAEGLTKITQATLAAVAKNPGIIGSDNAGLKKLVADIAGTLAANPLPAARDLAPVIVSLVLDRTAANLDLIWGGDIDDPGRNLLVIAARQTLSTLSMAVSGSPKPVTFARDQLLSIVDAVFAQVEQNPAWVVSKLDGGNPIVSAALNAVLDAFKGFKPSDLNGDLVCAVVLAGLDAVANRLEFLDKMPAPDRDAGKAMLTAVIGAILHAALDNSTPAPRRWQLARASVLQALIQAALVVLADKGATPATVSVVRLVLDDLVAGKVSPATFAKTLESKF